MKHTNIEESGSVQIAFYDSHHRKLPTIVIYIEDEYWMTTREEVDKFISVLEEY